MSDPFPHPNAPIRATRWLWAALGILLNVGNMTQAAAGETSLVSLSSTGQQGDKLSRFQHSSADGRFVVFGSEATNLVAGDTNGKMDIFLRDRQTGKIARLSVASNGQQANDASYTPLISANGRYVFFGSYATNLVPGDTNKWFDAFLYDRATGKLERIVNSSGQQPNGATYPSAISADGRFLALASEADNFVASDTNGQNDIFIRDRITGKTERVDIATDGSEATAGAWYYGLLSDDGRYVAYYSDSSNLVPGDTNGMTDIFVRDRAKSTTNRISVDSNGQQSNDMSYFPQLSSNGRFIAFASRATNLVPGDTNGRTDIFLHDQLTHTTTLINKGPGGQSGDLDSNYPDISADGRFVSYYSSATNLVAGDTNGVDDVFVYDRASNKTTRVSVNGQGQQGNGNSLLASMTRDGRTVGFYSEASNLVPNDTNAQGDVFVRDRLLDAKHEADVAVTQTDSPDPVNKGGLITYTIALQNNGPDTAPNVTLTDILPAKARFVSATASQGACSRGQTSICRLGPLAAGQQVTLTLTVRAHGMGTLVNQVHANANPKDPSPNNNRSLAVTTVSN